MSRYAEGTSVPMERSRAEAEKTLMRYGATGFAYAWERREERPRHRDACECKGSGRYTTRREDGALQVDPARPCWREPKPFQREIILVAFKMPTPAGERQVRLEVPMPHESEAGTRAKAEAATRQRWRALNLVLKAKLEAVASGIATLDSEFLANIVMQNGQTIGAAMLQRLPEVVSTGRLLPAAGETTR